MKVLAVVPARGGSKRLPGKNIMTFFGSPLITHTIRALRKAKLVTRFAVSTDDDDIALACIAELAPVIRRPAELARDDSPIEDALRHAVDYESVCGREYDIVLNVQGNIPIRKEGMFDRVIETLAGSEATAAATGHEVNHHPDWMKVLKGNYLYPYKKCEAFRKQDLEPLYMLDGAVIAVRTDVLMKTKGDSGPHRYMGDRILLVEQEEIYGLEIDTKEEMEFAEWVMSGKSLSERTQGRK